MYVCVCVFVCVCVCVVALTNLGVKSITAAIDMLHAKGRGHVGQLTLANLAKI